jgi:hypothetical protein
MPDVKKLSWAEFIAQFDESIQNAIENTRKKAGVEGMVMLVNHVLDSSRLGDKTAMIYGPACTYKSLEMIQERKGGVYTTGLPSSASFAETYTTDMP